MPPAQIAEAQHRASEWDTAHPRDSPPYCFANSYYVASFSRCAHEGTGHIGPEDTFDTDYGRLLEAVQNRGKGLASPRGIARMWTP